MAVAVLRVPSCAEAAHNLLEKLVESGEVDYYEVLNHGSDVVFYWRSLQPLEKKKVNATLVKRFEGSKCRERPHKAYLYYDEEGTEVWT